MKSTENAARTDPSLTGVECMLDVAGLYVAQLGIDLAESEGVPFIAAATVCDVTVEDGEARPATEDELREIRTAFARNRSAVRDVERQIGEQFAPYVEE